MFEPGEVVYAYVKNLYSPKYKYFVTIYRDDELRIVTCFTTTKNRVRSSLEQLKHGYVRYNNEIIGYFFDKETVVGIAEDGSPFSFPRPCVLPFDYGIQEGTKEQFLNNVEQEKVVCKLYEEEYQNIVYAMYRSPTTNPKYKPYLQKVLQNVCG